MTSLVGKHPYVALRIKLPKDKWIKRNCLIDTGFSGGIVLPEKLKRHFPTASFVEAHFILADGSEVTTDVTYTTIDYQGHQKEISVVFMGDSESLVGVEFLDQMRFCLDLKESRVELSR